MDDYIFKVKTARAKFRVKFSKNRGFRITDEGERETILLGYILTIGGLRAPDCLQINVPLKGDTGYFMWLQSAVGCALEINGRPEQTEIKGELTVHMARLGCSLARKINPELRFLELQDSASFTCVFPDGNSYAVNMTDHELAFYQDTYYGRRYGATFASKELQREFEALLPNFENPAKKPETFDFLVPALNDELFGLYTAAKTWKVFFEAISKKWGTKKCQIVYPWIKRALSHIFDGRSFSGQTLILDFDTIPVVRFSRVQDGGRGTRRAAQAAQPFPASPPQLAAMDWRKFLEAS